MRMDKEPNWNFICVVVVSLGIITSLIVQMEYVVRNWWFLILIVPLYVVGIVFVSRMYITTTRYEHGDFPNQEVRKKYYTDEQCQAINDRLVASKDRTRCVIIDEMEENEDMEDTEQEEDYDE